jgi:antitoxin ParD1/3/4
LLTPVNRSSPPTRSAGGQRKYDHPTEVIEDGLRLLEAREAKLERLRSAVEAGIASGEAVAFDMEEWLAEQERLDSVA